MAVAALEMKIASLVSPFFLPCLASTLTQTLLGVCMSGSDKSHPDSYGWLVVRLYGCME